MVSINSKAKNQLFLILHVPEYFLSLPKKDAHE